MKNKIFIGLMFIILFLIVISCNNEVSAITFEYDGQIFDTENYDFPTYEYNVAIYNEYFNQIYFVTSSVKFNVYLSSNGSYCLKYVNSYSLPISYGMYYLSIKNIGKYNINLTGVDIADSPSGGSAISNDTLIYNNYDLYDLYGNLVFKSSIFNDYIKELILYKSTNEYTASLPLVIYSQDFNENDILKYNMQYSKDNANWTDCGIRSITSAATGDTVYQFKLDVYENSTYYFRLQNKETGEYLYNSIIVDNIIYTQDNYNNYINGEFLPQPWFNYDYIDDTKIKMYSQSFTEEEIKKLECSFGKDLETADLDDNDKWTSLEVESSYSEISRSYEYRFILYVDNSNFDADGNYFFRFYIKDRDEYTYSSFKISFENIIEYNMSITNDEINKFVLLFRDRLGFLFYPVDLLLDILNKISNIDFGEPVISIPDIYEPFTGSKLISAVDFNFNDLLENENLNNVHEVYYVIIDALIAFALCRLLYSKLMGVLKSE